MSQSPSGPSDSGGLTPADISTIAQIVNDALDQLALDVSAAINGRVAAESIANALKAGNIFVTLVTEAMEVALAALEDGPFSRSTFIETVGGIAAGIAGVYGAQLGGAAGLTAFGPGGGVVGAIITGGGFAILAEYVAEYVAGRFADIANGDSGNNTEFNFEIEFAEESEDVIRVVRNDEAGGGGGGSGSDDPGSVDPGPTEPPLRTILLHPILLRQTPLRRTHLRRTRPNRLR